MKPIALIAVGGNSLERPGERGGLGQQRARARITCEGIAAVLAGGYRVVVTHGNGPQVGEALLRSELARAELPPLRLDACVAETQGSIGYLLQQSLENVLRERGFFSGVASVVTQVVVEASDPAFSQPSKPIGPFYRRDVARARERMLGWAMVEDAGRGWRRAVASPQPIELVELPAVRACLEAGIVVITAGGGGIPVVRTQGGLEGIEAVIDKDRAAAVLARGVGAELLLFSTDVDRVAWHYGQPDEKPLDTMTWEQAERYLREGEFPPGSMGPKIEAALEFLRAGGWRAVVTSPEKIAAAFRGEAGTEILPPVPAPREPVPIS